MEIGPISSIRALPSIKTPPSDPDLIAVFDIENSSRTGDETYSPSYQKSSGGQDSDDIDDLLTEEEPEPGSTNPSPDSGPPRQVSFFA